MSALQAWWQNLAPRERVLLGIGGTAALATLLFLFVLEPLQAQRARLHAQITAETRSLDTLRALVAEAATLRARGMQATVGALPAGQSLLAVLNTKAQARQVQDKVQRITPNGTREASVVFDDVEFTRLAGWLLDLRESHGIEAQRMVIDIAEAPGRVNANLTLAAREAAP